MKAPLKIEKIGNFTHKDEEDDHDGRGGQNENFKKEPISQKYCIKCDSKNGLISNFSNKVFVNFKEIFWGIFGCAFYNCHLFYRVGLFSWNTNELKTKKD